MSRANPARTAAAKALVAVESGAHLDDALAERAPAPGRDRELAWFLAFGVVRRRGHVDAALRVHLTRPLGGLDAEIRAVLRVGAFERLYARTRSHAVVHQAVEVARALGVGRASGLVNAVLRRVSEPHHLSRADGLDHPPWLVDRWDARYGEPATTAWCEANNHPPPLFLVERGPSSGPPLPGAVAAVGAGGSVAGVWRLAPDQAAPVPTLPGFAEGRWWVQDLAAVQMADLVPVTPGSRVLDACAAPGGKAFRLTCRGAQVVALDRDAGRLERLTESAARLGLTVETHVHDWHVGTWPDVFDAVLVDAPCTALGTVGRHPEVRWRRQPTDLTRAAADQQAILEACSASVRPGGSLIYTVCSPEPEEGTEVVSRFLATHPDFEQEEERATVPPRHGEDAHFGVRLRRKG